MPQGNHRADAWNDSSDPGGPAAIAAKKQLFDKFEALRNGRIDSVEVKADAAPYGKQVSSSPRVVKLSEFNVFFVEPKS